MPFDADAILKLKGIYKELEDKMYEEWFEELADGKLLIVHQDGTYEITDSDISELDTRAIDGDDDVKYVIWESMSYDGLTHFIESMLAEGPADAVWEMLDAIKEERPILPILLREEYFLEYFIENDGILKDHQSDKFYTTFALYVDQKDFWKNVYKNLGMDERETETEEQEKSEKSEESEESEEIEETSTWRSAGGGRRSHY